jgi:hypothetical protein
LRASKKREKSNVLTRQINATSHGNSVVFLIVRRKLNGPELVALSLAGPTGQSAPTCAHDTGGAVLRRHPDIRQDLSRPHFRDSIFRVGWAKSKGEAMPDLLPKGR